MARLIIIERKKQALAHATAGLIQDEERIENEMYALFEVKV